MLNETFSMVFKHCENIRQKMEQLPEAPQSRGFISTLFFWFENTNRGRDDYFETVTLHNGSGWKLAFSLAENYKGVNCRSSIWREVGERATTTISEVEIWQKLSWQFMPRLKRGLHFLISAREMLSSRCFESAEEPSSVDLNLVNALSNQPRKPAATNFTWWYICSAIH